MKLHFVVAVWGAWHRNVFKGKSLPTILHESNLPSLGIECDFLIYTNEGDRGAFEDDLRTIGKFCPAEVRHMQMPEGYKTAWQDAVLNADQGDLLVFLQSDLVWSKGSFAHIGELVRSGKSLIYIPHLRGTEAFYPRHALTGDELTRIAAEDNHPVNASRVYGERGFTRHPEMVLWKVTGGWVSRLYAREPIVCPAWMRFNGHNLPKLQIPWEQIHLIDSSDKACAVSLSTRDKEHDHYRGSQAICSPGIVSGLSEGHQCAVTLPLARQHSILRYGLMDQAEVDKVIKDSAQFTEEALEWIARPPRPMKTYKSHNPPKRTYV